MRACSRIWLPVAGLFILSSSAAAGTLPEIDLSSVTRPAPATSAASRPAAGDEALRQLARPGAMDERYGVPTFLWAVRPAGSDGAVRSTGTVARSSAETAARTHLARLAPFYRLDAADAGEAVLHSIHDTGQGGIIASFRQRLGDVEVFRDEVRILMDRNLGWIAAAGFIPGRASFPPVEAAAWRLNSTRAVAAALTDFGAGDAVRGLRSAGAAAGDYEQFDIAEALRPARLSSAPIRARKVLFHLPATLEPGWYVEVMSDAEAYSYVISARDGGVLYRHCLTESDSYGYRVWASGAPLYLPDDGPQGTSASPHPTGTPNLYDPPLILPSLITLQNGPISTNDPWLPPAATSTVGNNVDAYVDEFSPDGFTAGDIRATTTSPGTFDRTYDTSSPPTANDQQRMAACTQLFFIDNLLHDWFYDVGFNEAAGNAQTSNFGRGGLEGDALHAEAQDYSGSNNANMSTPSDGGSPRMQMYTFTLADGGMVTVSAPAAIAGNYVGGIAGFGPGTFNVIGAVALANDGVGTTSDGCEAIGGTVAGKIALIDRGNCPFVTKVQNAQNAGAIGVIIVDNTGNYTPTTLAGSSGAITIPALAVNQTVGNSIRAQLGGGVTAQLIRQQVIQRDGTLDGHIVSHEWGHYISNRLIGDANGLNTQMSAGLGEGWADFNALLMTVRPEDAVIASNPNWTGLFPAGGYALSGNPVPNNSYYFGVRRVPYSTDFAKDALTFRHIQNGVALPVGPPTAFGADGANNSEVHDTGEVWCTMLWECYAALLRDTGRLTFAQARDHMRAEIVAGYKMTPNQPTLLEARDALLAAALANDPQDFAAFWQAFARRGAGVGAVAPDRFSDTNVGVTESYVVGGDLALLSATLTDDVKSCDHDGYVDEGESGLLKVTLQNVGSVGLSGTTASVSSASPAVSFPNGNAISFAASSPLATIQGSVLVHVSGAAGLTPVTLQIQFNDPGLALPGPRTGSWTGYMNADETPSSNESVEAQSQPWTLFTSPVLAPSWQRVTVAAADHRFYAPDVAVVGDQRLTSPALQVGGGTFSIVIAHRHSFEGTASSHYDGGVVELSNNGGASWSDIGSLGSPGYNGTLFTGSSNPLSGRTAYTNRNPSYPNLDIQTINLGTSYSGQTVQVRLRLATDEGTGDFGWEVASVQFNGLTNTPFLDATGETTPCLPLDTPVLPAEVSFALAGSNPVTGPARFHFALPAASRVTIAVFDIAGRRIATIADGTFEAGDHDAVWATTDDGTAPRAGVYLARMRTGGRAFTRRLIVLP